MQTYGVFIERVKDIHRLGALQGHLGWDQETIMPSKGSDARSDILSWLAAERHERLTDPEMGQMLDSLEQEQELDADQRANVREMRRAYDKRLNFHQSLLLLLQKQNPKRFFLGKKPGRILILKHFNLN